MTKYKYPTRQDSEGAAIAANRQVTLQQRALTNLIYGKPDLKAEESGVVVRLYGCDMSYSGMVIVSDRDKNINIYYLDEWNAQAKKMVEAGIHGWLADRNLADKCLTARYSILKALKAQD